MVSKSKDIILDFISKAQKSDNINQENLFSGKDTIGLSAPILQDFEPWGKEECLKHEKQLIGFYLTSNPLEKFDKDLQELSFIPEEIDENSIIRIGGIITDIQYRFDKNGNKWALITLDILKTSIQVYIFNDTFNKYNEIIAEDEMCFIIGKSFY